MKRNTYRWLFILLAIAVTVVYWIFFMSNTHESHNVTVKIPTGSKYEDVLELLRQNHVLENEISFTIVSKLKHYPQRVKPGNYLFYKGMNNRQMINMLEFGLQTPVTLVIYNIRTKEEFAGLVGRTLELDSNAVLAKLNEDSFCKQYGLDTSTILTHFLVDNYEFYWTVSMDMFLERMNKSYNSFWNKDRLAKADAIHLSPTKVTILASIVEKEVMHDVEMARVAGVYMNRLRLGMPLQADPTLVFALHDFDAKRVNSYHKEYDSRYNTYKYAGLPPGPVCMPYHKSIDAVLNAEKNDFLYFCADPSLNGYSIFSKTLKEQMDVAAQYRKKLDMMGVH